MRANELCTLTQDRVCEDHCFLPVTKTTKRTVPLTRKALRIIDKMRDYDPELVFGPNASSPKFFDPDQGTLQRHPVAAGVVAAIAKLYAIESRAADCSPPHITTLNCHAS